MINVLIVEDSSVARDLITYILKSDKNINVLGAVKNGMEAIDFIEVQKPDVITMDINMPVMNGIEATKIIMRTNPVPIIVVSSNWNSKDVEDSFNALQIGAVAIAEKPVGFEHSRFNTVAENLLQMIRLMSEIRVVKRTFPGIPGRNKQLQKTFDNTSEIVKIICIGASTGGPVVIESILSNLAVPFNIPIVIVQHIMAGFVEGFVEWLNHSSKVKVKLAEQGEEIKNNFCYVAPDGYHLTISVDRKIYLQNKAPVNGLKPSVSSMFDSVLESFGKGCLAILLSGMGKDGALELKKLKNAGATTIVQDKESAVVYGMPGEAVKLDAASYIYTPGEIVTYLNGIASL